MKKISCLFNALSMMLILQISWSFALVVEAAEPTGSAVAVETPIPTRLQLKEKRLNAELKSLDRNDPDFLILSQSIREELADVRRQIQNATKVKPFAFSELGPMVPEDDAMSGQQALSAPRSPSSHETLPKQGTFQPQNTMMGQERQLPVGPVNLFAQIKAELSLQLTQIQQMLQSIGKHDGRLATLLQGQEKEILNQLREVDRQIAEMTAAQGPVSQTQRSDDMSDSKALKFSDTAPVETKPEGVSVGSISADTGGVSPATNDTAVPLGVTIPPRSTYAWAPVAGNDPALSSARDPFATPPSPEVLEIKKLVTELKEEITKLQAELTAINTQLRLISFRIAGDGAAQTAGVPNQGTRTAVKSGETPVKADSTAKPADSKVKTDKK